jgi:SAM-dependent methyltransferase
VTVGLTAPRLGTWSAADPYAAALRSGRGPLFLHRADGWLLPLDVERWCSGPDAADRTVLDACDGPTLDVGCGPGRFVVALAAQGCPALGIDVSAEAVSRTTGVGGAALQRSVFDPLPGEGRWRTALLIDGNIGIGGNPATLLARIRHVLHSTGSLLVETAPAGTGDDLDERVDVRLHDGISPHGGMFAWARVGPRALARHAEATGWTPAETWTAGGRRFARLRPA